MKTSGWITIDGTGQTCQPDGADVPRAAPAPASPIAFPMPVRAANAQLVVAPIEDAALLETASAGDAGFSWSELAGAEVSQLVALQCITEGVDPNAPLEGVPPKRNPFTGEMVRRLTAFDRAFEQLEIVLGGKLVPATPEELDGQQPDALVVRLPPAFVAWLAALSPAALAELAVRWSAACSFTAEAASGDLELLVTAAKTAASAKKEVFVWTAG